MNNGDNNQAGRRRGGFPPSAFLPPMERHPFGSPRTAEPASPNKYDMSGPSKFGSHGVTETLDGPRLFYRGMFSSAPLKLLEDDQPPAKMLSVKDPPRRRKQVDQCGSDYEQNILNLFRQLSQKRDILPREYEMLWCWKYHDIPDKMQKMLLIHGETHGDTFQAWVWETLTLFNYIRRQSRSDLKSFKRLLEEHFDDLAPSAASATKRENRLTLKDAFSHPCSHCQ